mmetsp:Transcript_27936/g.41252  ORF Transcript_27936/g.41252 Transcript_27936/m.41252 type:complete len:206 (-) Transcript_27936:179-796(-)
MYSLNSTAGKKDLTMRGPTIPLVRTAAQANRVLISPLATGRKGLFSLSIPSSKIWLIPTIKAFPNNNATIPMIALGSLTLHCASASVKVGVSTRTRTVPAIDARTVPRIVCGLVNLYNARSLALTDPALIDSTLFDRASGSKSPSTAARCVKDLFDDTFSCDCFKGEHDKRSAEPLVGRGIDRAFVLVASSRAQHSKVENRCISH